MVSTILLFFKSLACEIEDFIVDEHWFKEGFGLGVVLHFDSLSSVKYVSVGGFKGQFVDGVLNACLL